MSRDRDVAALRQVVNVRRGPVEANRNGIRTYAFAQVVLECGHVLMYPRLRGLTARPPARVRCPYHEAAE